MPLLILGLISAGISIAQLIAHLVEQGQTEAAAKEAISNATNIPIPKIESMQYDPALQNQPIQQIVPGVTQGAQMDALRQLQQTGATGGMDSGSTAALQQAEQRTEQDVQGQEQAIQAQTQRQGITGGGQQIAQQEAAIQGSANRLAMAGTQAVADARTRALSAIRDSGRLAGDIRSQDEAVQTSNRDAAIARDRFNAEVTNAARQFNAGAPERQAAIAQGRAGAVTNATTAYGAGVRGDEKQTNTDVNDVQDSLASGAAAYSNWKKNRG